MQWKFPCLFFYFLSGFAACLVLRQKVQGLNSDSGMDICSGLYSTLNRGSGLFTLQVRKMTVVRATSQPFNLSRPFRNLNGFNINWKICMIGFPVRILKFIRKLWTAAKFKYDIMVDYSINWKTPYIKFILRMFMNVINMLFGKILNKWNKPQVFNSFQSIVHPPLHPPPLLPLSLINLCWDFADASQIAVL